ncbi:MAG: hypothetical protein ACK502_09435 [Alphaproteobacteria bacterium]
MEDSWRDFARHHDGKTSVTVQHVHLSFKRSLGNQRTSLEGNKLCLAFDLNDAAQLFQFNHLSQFLYQKHMRFTSSANEKQQATLVLELATAQQLDLTLLLDMSKRLGFKAVTASGEIVAHVDPEHPIVVATQVPWQVVRGSPYGVETLEPIREGVSVDDQRRRAEEFAVGIALRDDDGKSVANIEEWLSHQRKVEEKEGIAVHTAIPRDWASKDGTFRGRLLQEKESLSRMFSGSIKK